MLFSALPASADGGGKTKSPPSATVTVNPAPPIKLLNITWE
jgi:hypothetical protein